jgi:hypothetical protein
MLIVALVLAVIGLAALVTAVVTSNELIAWVCIAASVIGVVLLIVDALRERSRGGADAPAQAPDKAPDEEFDEEYPDEPAAHPDAESTEAPAAEPVESDVAEAVEEDRPR